MSGRILRRAMSINAAGMSAPTTSIPTRSPGRASMQYYTRRPHALSKFHPAPIMDPMPQVVFLQTVPRRKEPPAPAPALRLIDGLGIDGDCHARRGGSRQVLLMAEENCDAFGLAPGEVRENIVTRGLDLQALPAGTRLEIGGAALEITKDCEPCAFIDTLRPGL